MRIVLGLSCIALVTSQLAAQSGSAPATKVDTKTFSSDWLPGTRPRDAFADKKGRVWFVGQVGNYVARLDPATGDIKKFEIDEGTHPHNLVVDTHGTVWFTGNANNRIVKMDPESGKLTTYMIPDLAVKDPHTMTFDKKGDAWFTAQNSGYVGRFTPSTGAFKLWKLPNAKPYGIVIDSRGRPWFDEFATNKIGTIDPATLELKEYPLPNARTLPRRIAITSDDAVWYGDYSRGYLGRLDPRTGKTEEYPLPSGAKSLPYGMTVDDRDRVWIVETGVLPNRLVSFDTKRRTFEDQIPIGGSEPNTIRHMVFDPTSRLIWFGEDRGTITRVTVPAVIVP
jgi:virginiamycin B lyase